MTNPDQATEGPVAGGQAQPDTPRLCLAAVPLEDLADDTTCGQRLDERGWCPHHGEVPEELTGPMPQPDTPTDPEPSLHDAIAHGIDRAIRDAGATLTGCTPSMMTGHVIREIRAAGLHPTERVPADVARAAELIHEDIGAAMEVLYGEIGGKDDTADDVAATSKTIADDMRRVLEFVLAAVRGEPHTNQSARRLERVRRHVEQTEATLRSALTDLATTADRLASTRDVLARLALEGGVSRG